MKFLLKSMVASSIVAASMGAMASPCDNAMIELHNETDTVLKIVDIDLMGETTLTPGHASFEIRAGDTQVFDVSSGVNTHGNAKGVITFINKDNMSSDKPHKFMTVTFDFENKLWLSCDKHVEVFSRKTEDYKPYVVPGFKNNVKVFVVN